VRLRLDLRRVAAEPQPDVAALPVETQSGLRRWARAVTDRRVGVALGGGGAWGYAHVALLRAMVERGVPIDVVSGASFGSVVGAYFCAGGVDGLDRFMDRILATQLAIQAGMVTLATMEWLIDHDLDGARLEDLEVPLLPASTDLGTGAQRVVARGTVGFGVRASGSFPGMFAATRVRGARYVDGALSSNVPDDVLAPEGATLTVASNIIAEPAPPSAERNLIPGALGRFLADVNPIRRATDLVRGTMIMLHAVSHLDASTSDVMFESPPVPYWFWQSGKGRDIEERARPRAREVAEAIARRWQSLRDPRDPDPLASGIADNVRHDARAGARDQ
jgi:predicted acylesterase/phospholipase RssA